MKKLLNLLLIILLSVTLSNCKKKPEPTLLEQMAERTETGEERLVGIVNNEYIFSNNGGMFVTPDYGLHSWYTESTSGLLHIKGTYYDYDNIINFINLFADDVIQSGVYYYPNSVFSNVFGYECGTYNLDTLFTNSINITNLDYSNNIVSGAFEMRVIKDNCDTLTLTEGRFDLSGS